MDIEPAQGVFGIPALVEGQERPDSKDMTEVNTAGQDGQWDSEQELQTTADHGGQAGSVGNGNGGV